jgi:hypothetical protein
MRNTAYFVGVFFLGFCGSAVVNPGALIEAAVPKTRCSLGRRGVGTTTKSLSRYFDDKQTDDAGQKRR